MKKKEKSIDDAIADVDTSRSIKMDESEARKVSEIIDKDILDQCMKLGSKEDTVIHQLQDIKKIVVEMYNDKPNRHVGDAIVSIESAIMSFKESQSHNCGQKD